MVIYVSIAIFFFVNLLRMTTGLSKLVEAAASVDILKKELEVKEQEIKEATANAEEVSTIIGLCAQHIARNIST